jgi:hypothetical protein
MKREVVIAAFIYLANLVLVTLMYLTVGWHFIRGYEEVGDFVIIPFVVGQAGVNLIIALPIALVRRRRRKTSGRITLASLSLSAALILLSPLFAPVIGRVAKQNLWIETPLVEAARYGDSNLVIALLQQGANANVKHPVLRATPLHYMAAQGELKAVNALLASGADPNAKEGGLETPLHWAVQYRVDVAVVKSLVEHGSDPTIEDAEGKTPIDYTDVIPDPTKKQILAAMGRDEINESAEAASLP